MSFNSKLDDTLDRLLEAADMFYHNGVGNIFADKETTKQSIIQAVLDELPEKHELNTVFDTEYKETLKIQGRLEGYNQAIDDIRESIEGSDD